MFEDSLFASNTRNYPKTWTPLASIAIQTLFVGTLIVVPMLFTDALPWNASRAMVRLQPITRETPAKIKPTVQPKHDESSGIKIIRVPPSRSGVAVRARNPLDDRIGRNVDPPLPAGMRSQEGDKSQLSVLLSPGQSLTPTIRNAPPKRWRVSGGVEQGLILLKVKPIYPAFAQAARLQGEVVLQAVIGRDGKIKNLHAISGNPLLVKPALDAVQQWRYRPYMLNDEPVEVETEITVSFTVS